MQGTLSLFPTPIYIDPALVDNYDIVQREVKGCLTKILETNDLNEVSWIHEEAAKVREQKRHEEHSYLITDDLIGKYNLIELKKRIFNAVENYINSTKWGRLRTPTNESVDYKIQLRNSWMNIQSKNKSHEWHCHPGYTIAGVYYMRVSADQGGIQFQNPNVMMQWCHFPEGPRTPQSIEIIPKDGDIVLFPAWLMHNTMPNTTDEDRISVAFNIDLIVPPKQDDPGNSVQDFTKKSVEELMRISE